MNTNSTSSQPATRWTGPNRQTRMMRAQAPGMRSAHGEFSHPVHKGVVVLGVLGPESPWDRLATILSQLPFRDWPTDGWILTMELRCPHCLETRLVEIIQTHRGDRILCAVCGKEGPLVTATHSEPMSGK